MSTFSTIETTTTNLGTFACDRDAREMERR